LRRNDSAFVDADPAVYNMRAVHNEAGKPNYSKLADASGLNARTVSNLLQGKTKRPQHFTVVSLLERGYGASVTWRAPNQPARIIRLGRR
jgi:hypothetical protein